MLPSERTRLRGARTARLLAVFLACLGLASAVAADERILAYHADVSVQEDASLIVTETLRVRAEGRDIRRGIYRDFPTRYRDRRNNRYRVDFELLEVLRDGAPEPHHTEARSNGVRIYVGAANRYLDPGVYEYRIRYRTTRQIGFFEEFDELYWNVTGNGWAFPIDQASARVALPAPIPREQLKLAWYTGPQGAAGQAATGEVREGGRAVWFETTAPLRPREGLTVAVAWPKGIVAEPTFSQKAAWFLRDNGGALVLLLAFPTTLAWYLWAWNRRGRDPRKGVIIPRYASPKGLSPAACRYVQDMGFGRQAFTAAIVSLGVKGHLAIQEDDGDFTLVGTPTQAREAPSPGERAVLDALLPNGTGSIALEQEHHAKFRAARSGVAEALKREYKGRLFNLNGLYALPAFFLTVVATVLAVVFGQRNPLIWVAWALGAVGLHLLFIFLLRAPTVVGRKVMDEIEGFKLYLGTAEQDRLDRMESPELTPEVFETFLPYAFALGVENRWVERFEQAFPEGDPAREAWRPGWYYGDFSGTRALSHIGSDLGSGLSSAISSAATPPGSSSGSGGGGFSGGGGGGGGGGGW